MGGIFVEKSRKNKRLNVNQITKILIQLSFNFFHVNELLEFFGERGYAFVHKPAWVDVGKIGQVGIDVEGKAVHGDVSGRTYANGTDFSGVPS